MNGNDYNFFVLGDFADRVLPFSLEHVGLGIFKISVLLIEMYFSLGLNDIVDGFTYLG
jgi:hypothetical protein